ncbi:hypothetical protein CVT24_008450 [Panaeolus cyanescens]|uniref:GST N-terminal domain-containing protein n=1 Tax=Panaeolus cyanescens TaxID=181874 RepID=A0A409VBZ9_9AGAR|nr:hypothetical protein CVT24_008450 [Panaeolus cyanescens]
MGVPDEKIFPHATAAAAETVAKHQEPQELFCPFVQRSWIALEEKGIPYQYKEVNPYKKEAHFLAINPKGLVPAVEYKGKALYESLILNEFFEEAYPGYKPLLPKNPEDRAIARIWLDHQSKTFIPAFHRLLSAQEPQAQDAARQELYESLRKYMKQVQGPYFFGEEFTLVDVAIAPWTVRDYVLAENRGYKRGDVGEGWKEYAERLASRDTVKRTESLREHLDVIYGRYLRDEAQSEAAKAIRAGRVIP